MMLVMEVVTTALLLVIACSVTAQKPTTIDGISVHTNHRLREGSTFLDQPSTLVEISPDHQTKDILDDESLQNEGLKSEVFLACNESTEGTDNSGDYENQEEVERNERRMKRKVIFGGGSYGGHGSRRTSATGADPYGRRRGHYDPETGPYESYPYHRQDIPNADDPMNGDQDTQGRTYAKPVYAIIRPTEPDSHSPSSSADTHNKRDSSVDDIKRGDKQDSSVGSIRRAKAAKDEMTKQKLTKNLKWEIAKFAEQNGAHQAAEKFEEIVGRKLPLKKIEKFIKRYQKQQKRDPKY